MSKEVEVLNKILSGEKMAMEIMGTYQRNIKDTKVKEYIQKWISDHQNNANQIADFITKTGEKPEANTGVAGFMARTTAMVNSFFNSEPLDILHEIYDGEDKGIERSVQITKNELSPEGTQLVEKVFHIDHHHLEEMKQLITNYENI